MAALAAIGVLGHKRKMQERVGLKKPLSVGGHAARGALLGAPYYVGRGIAEGQKEPSKRWVKKAARAQERLKAKKFALHPALPLIAVASVPWAVGAGVLIAAKKRKRARTQKRLVEKGYALEPVEVLIYEQGYQYGLRSFLRRHKVGQRLKRGALPAALSGLVLEGLRRAHTEIGIPPTTVDLVPVLRTTIKSEFAPYTNMQLMGFRSALQNKLAMVDEATANEIKKQVGKINIEIIGRRAV